MVLSEALDDAISILFRTTGPNLRIASRPIVELQYLEVHFSISSPQCPASDRVTFMTVESPTWRVGIAGLNPSGLFTLEQLSLDSRFTIVEIAATDQVEANLIESLRYPISTKPANILASPETDLVFVNEEIDFDTINAALRQGKHIVCHDPWMFSADQWSSLRKLASVEPKPNTISALIRWSSEFTVSDLAIRSNRLGCLKSVRMTICDKAIPEREVVDVLRDFGFERLFQLVSLVSSQPQSVYARRFCNIGKQDIGFLAMISFADGCLAQIEINTDSRLSFRTGWILEGSTGSFRNDRLYTTADDGEFVDEPFVPPAMPSILFGDEIARNLQPGEENEQHVDRIIRSMRLIEAIEWSAKDGTSVDL